MLNVGFFTVIRVLKAKINQYSSVTDPVHFFRIRIHRSGFQNPDPDPVDPKKTGSDRIRILLRYVFHVQQNKQLLYGIFIPNLNILYDTSSKIKKNIFGKLYFRQFYITRKLELQGSFFWIKDPDPVFSRVRILVTKKAGSNRNQDPDPQHCRIEIIQFLRYFCCVYL